MIHNGKSNNCGWKGGGGNAILLHNVRRRLNLVLWSVTEGVGEGLKTALLALHNN